jgi:hypothetical protein
MKPRFTIRDLVWLTLVVAMGVGWWLDHARLTAPVSPYLQWFQSHPSTSFHWSQTH